MKKSLLDESIDQTAHALSAFVIIVLALKAGPIGCAVAGFTIGFVREYTEEEAANGHLYFNWRNVFSKGSLIDLAFWTIGGLIAGLLFS